MPITNSNIKLPHWIVGGEPIYNQVDAWKQITTTKKDYRFYFFEEQYDQLDWTKEPNDDWDTMVTNKLLMLRQKYKKLSLFYSAGRDSHMILRHFYKTGIKLDSIVMLRMLPSKVRMFELENYIMPKVQEFTARYPNTKVNFVTYDESIFKSYFRDGWIYQPHQSMRMNFFFPSDYGWFLKYTLDPDLNNGYIVGSDKPRLWIEDNKVYSLMIDKTIDPFLTDMPNLELFYYSPDYPELYLKQNWMMLNYLEQNFSDRLTPEFLNEFIAGKQSAWWYDQLCLSCGRGPAFDLSLSIQNGQSKPTHQKNDPKYAGVLDKALDYKWKAAAVYADSIEQITKELSETLTNGDFYQGVTGILSKKYFMKELPAPVPSH